MVMVGARTARGAAQLAQLAMHMNQPLTARALVQIVDILGDQQKIAAFLPDPGALERCQGGVGWVWRHLVQVRAAQIIEMVHKRWVALETARRGDILDVMPLPQPARIAEGGNA